MRDIYTHFVRESNKIEGILRPPTKTELYAHRSLIEQKALAVDHLVKFVLCVQPNAVLRDKPGRDVSVRGYYPPPGNWNIRVLLEDILRDLSVTDSHTIYCRYESLHPFTDGNGRSGRALWLWVMAQRGLLDHALEYGFLRPFHYQTLQAFDTGLGKSDEWDSTEEVY